MREIVHRGDALGMFPEGTRQEREPGPVMPGAAMIAVQEGAPVVCGAIHGSPVLEARATSTRSRSPSASRST